MTTSISDTVVHKIRKQAKRILAGNVKGSDDQRIFPGYFSFDQEERPHWWKKELAPDGWGAVLGVHEAERDSADRAIVVTEAGLGVLNKSLAPSWLPYEAVKGWAKLSKEPISTALVVQTRSGSELELFFPQAGAFAFVQFLGYATEQLLREKRRGLGD